MSDRLHHMMDVLNLANDVVATLDCEGDQRRALPAMAIPYARDTCDELYELAGASRLALETGLTAALE